MQCSFIKPNGTRCRSTATGQQGLCWAHDPENASARKQIAAKGGKGKAASRTRALWDEVHAVIEDVRAKRLQPSQANSMCRGYTLLIELAKLQIDEGGLEVKQRHLELDVEERRELLQYVEELEEALKHSGARYGA